MNPILPQQKKSFFKLYWWVFALCGFIILLAVIVVLLLTISKKDEHLNQDNNQNNSQNSQITNSVSNNQSNNSEKFPKCPSDLSGLLTVSMINPASVTSLVPLGNSVPPGHTFPVDHIYFDNVVNNKQLFPIENFYTPGDSTITNILYVTNYDLAGKVKETSYAIDFTLCEGVILKLGGIASINQKLQSELDKLQGKCKTSPPKHDNESKIEMCDFALSYFTKAGEQIGTTGGDQYPEVWAFNMNVQRKSNVDWYRYGYNQYGYAFCLFDLYKSDLKNTWYSKFGYSSYANAYKDSNGNYIKGDAVFKPRTVEPICGSVNQDVNGTIQGDWFGEPKSQQNSPEFDGKALSLVHDNLEPTQGRIVVAGTISNPGTLYFTPTHQGQINREFSEVKADGKIYCYQKTIERDSSLANVKLLFQLVDDKHIKVEAQQGACTGSESFNKNYDYDR